MPEKAKGIVVLGFPRSGTTLVRRLLDAHPNIACPGETCLLSACARFLHSEVVSDGLEFGVLNGLAFAGTDSNEVLRRLRAFAFGFHEDYARMRGKPRWAEKTAVDIFHMQKIELLCADQVQYVCIVRHGLDAACSVQELSNRGHTYLSELHEYVKRYARPLEAFAHAWVDVNLELLGFLERQGENALLLQYENLTANPVEETRRLCQFVGEEWTPDLLTRATGKADALGLGDWKTFSRTEIDASSVKRWKKLPPHLVDRLAGICNGTLEEFGYDPVPSRPVGSQAAARRRYELGLLLGAGKREPDA